MDKYFLFGGDAVRIFNEDGIGKLLKYINDGGDFDTFHWTKDCSPSDILYAYSGWDDYAEVSYKQFKKILGY